MIRGSPRRSQCRWILFSLLWPLIFWTVLSPNKYNHRKLRTVKPQWNLNQYWEAANQLVVRWSGWATLWQVTPLLLEVERANQSATLPLALVLVSFKPMLSEPKLVKQPQRQSPLAHQPELNLLVQDRPMWNMFRPIEADQACKPTRRHYSSAWCRWLSFVWLVLGLVRYPTSMPWHSKRRILPYTDLSISSRRLLVDLVK